MRAPAAQPKFWPHRASLLPCLVVAGVLTGTVSGGALAQELPDLVPPSAEPIRTAPAMRGVRGALSLQATAPSAAVSGAQAGQDDDVPWVLEPSQHPWPLRYIAPNALNGLLISIPSVAEARLMLPGRLADAVENARFAANKYLTDVIGVAVQDRRRQAEQVEEWLARVASQAREVEPGEWPQYQFNREARKTMLDFRAQLDGQSAAGMQQLLSDAQDAITRMNELMGAMTTHELSMGWYNIMVQLRNGVAMYQSQVEQSDARTIALADSFLTQTPELPRPRGTPPAAGKPGGSRVPAVLAAAAVTLSTPMAAPVRAPELAPAEQKQDSFGGLVVMGGVIAAILFLARRLKKRPQAAKPPTE